jgi:restriction system protein
MSIPDFQAVMLPLLRQLADERERLFRDIVEDIAREFRLTEEERRQLLPSGQQPLFTNRVGWARAYLKQAGLIESTRRANMKITKRGVPLLREAPSAIILEKTPYPFKLGLYESHIHQPRRPPSELAD